MIESLDEQRRKISADVVTSSSRVGDKIRVRGTREQRRLLIHVAVLLARMLLYSQYKILFPRAPYMLTYTAKSLDTTDSSSATLTSYWRHLATMLHTPSRLLLKQGLDWDWTTRIGLNL